MSPENQDALRCAEWQEQFRSSLWLGKSAAHIRRLVAENEAKDALLRQAVEAWDSNEIDTDPVAAVIEAIRTYLTQKGATK